MILTGYFAGVAEDLISGKARITFEVNERMKAVQVHRQMKTKELKISIAQNRKRRSLNANSYYWTLVGKIAEAINTSSAQVHNTMLRRYGQILMIDDQAVFLSLKDTEAVQKAVDEADNLHLRPTAEVRSGKDGYNYRTYLLLKGSHELDTKEMSRLIDGVISEAQELDIETLPPHEVERMKQLWKA